MQHLRRSRTIKKSLISHDVAFKWQKNIIYKLKMNFIELLHFYIQYVQLFTPVLLTFTALWEKNNGLFTLQWCLCQADLMSSL